MTNKNKIIIASITVALIVIISLMFRTTTPTFKSDKTFDEFTDLTAVIESPVAVKHLIKPQSRAFYGLREKYWRQSQYKIIKSETVTTSKDWIDENTVKIQAQITMWVDEKTGTTPLEDPDIIIIQQSTIEKQQTGVWLMVELKEDWVILNP